MCNRFVIVLICQMYHTLCGQKCLDMKVDRDSKTMFINVLLRQSPLLWLQFFHQMLAAGICSYLHSSISEVQHWFQFIPKVLDGVEVRARSRQVKFFHLKPGKPFISGFLYRVLRCGKKMTLYWQCCSMKTEACPHTFGHTFHMIKRW